MKVLLPAYKSMSWIVEAYAHMHEMYWGAPVILLAEEDYSEGRFECASPPWKEDATWVDGDVPGEIPGHHFTDVLIWYLKQIKDKHVIIMLADYLLTAPVNTYLMLQLQEYMELHDEVLRGHIDSGGGFCRGQKTDTYKDLEIWEGNFLPTSLTPAIWNRRLLLEMMPHRTTALGFENAGGNKFPWDGCRSIATNPGMVHYINCVRGRDMSYMVMTHEVFAEIGQYLQIKTYHWSDD